MGERKEETRERGVQSRVPVGFTGDVGGEGEIEAVRHKPAQDLGDSPISRITYHGADTCLYACAFNCVCTCTERQP